MYMLLIIDTFDLGDDYIPLGNNVHISEVIHFSPLCSGCRITCLPCLTFVGLVKYSCYSGKLLENRSLYIVHLPIYLEIIKVQAPKL